MAGRSPSTRQLLFGNVPTRLASTATIVVCALVAAMNAIDADSPQVLAASDSVRASGQGTPDANRVAIDSSTASVAAHALVASPAFTSLPTAATTSPDLPVAAMNAYERAEQVIDSVRPGCHLGWPILAAIGQVESDHGRSAGGDLQIDGISTTPVRGAVLDGSRSTARVADTDGGQLDGTSAWDRAVGPMQFLPSTWINVRVDGDDDGIRSPDDIDDASLAAAVFLCAWGDDLATSAGATKAVGQYNHTPGYAPTVLSLARTYGSDSYLTPTWTGAFVQTRATNPAPAAASRAGTTSTVEAASTPPTGSATSSPVAVVTSSATPSASPSPAATPVENAAAASPTATATTTPTTFPTPAPSPTPTPTPFPTPAPSPTPTPTPTTLTGTLGSCGERTFCLDDQVVDFGVLDAPAASDIDGDQTVETRLAELTGLVGKDVAVTVEGSGAARVVTTVVASTW